MEQINPDILLAYGAVTLHCHKGTLLFTEGATPVYYYQLISGEVKVYYTNSGGRDLIQGIFSAGQSFGEPPLLAGKPYPSSAIACTEVLVLRIKKERLMEILKDYPDLALSLLVTFAGRIYNKATTSNILATASPEEKLLVFFNKIRAASPDKKTMEIPYTRQQIADFTGLRVETVIRSLLKMAEAGKLVIKAHKVYC